MTPDYRLTIAIPTHDRPGMLPDALDRALNQTTPARIVISDNLSLSCRIDI